VTSTGFAAAAAAAAFAGSSHSQWRKRTTDRAPASSARIIKVALHGLTWRRINRDAWNRIDQIGEN